MFVFPLGLSLKIFVSASFVKLEVGAMKIIVIPLSGSIPGHWCTICGRGGGAGVNGY